MKKIISLFTGTILVLSTLGSFVTVANAADVTFEDDNLKKKLVSELDTNKDKKVSTEELAAVDSLDLSEGKIAKLNGLEGAVNLEALVLSDNQITDLTPLAGLTKIKYLTIKNNSVTDITPIKDMVGLTSLDISFNSGLSNISALEGMNEIRELNASNCAISDISVLDKLVRVKRLYLNNNQIVDTSIFTSLASVQRSNPVDPLEDPAGATRMKLQLLNISYNPVVELPNMASFSELYMVDLSGTQVTDLLKSLRNNNKFSMVVLNDMNLTSLEMLKGLTRLTGVEASHNNLTDLSVFSEVNTAGEYVFKSMKYVTLTYNPALSDLSALKSLVELSRVDVRETAVTEEIANDLAATFTATEGFEVLWGEMPPDEPDELDKCKKPAKIKPKKIKTSTKKITGTTTKKATVKLYAGKKQVKSVKATSKGKFVFQKLNLKKFKAGTTIKIVATKKNWDDSKAYTTKLKK